MAIPKRQRGARITAREMVETLKNEGVAAELIGLGDLVPTHVAKIDKADRKSLTFYIGGDAQVVERMRDCVLFCKPDLVGVHESVSRIVVDDQRLAFTIIAQEFLPPLPKAGIHPTAIIAFN